MKRLAVPLLLSLIAGACVAAPPGATGGNRAVELHGHHFSVELATNDAQREHGLMMRASMAADHGMLFVFPDARPQTFWMKDTLIPLDILFFDADRKLVSMQLDAPPCKADPCGLYPSDRPARYVLELNAGMATKIGAEVGDTLTIDGTVGTVQ